MQSANKKNTNSPRYQETYQLFPFHASMQLLLFVAILEQGALHVTQRIGTRIISTLQVIKQHCDTKTYIVQQWTFLWNLKYLIHSPTLINDIENHLSLYDFINSSFCALQTCKTSPFTQLDRNTSMTSTFTQISAVLPIHAITKLVSIEGQKMIKTC